MVIDLYQGLMSSLRYEPDACGNPRRINIFLPSRNPIGEVLQIPRGPNEYRPISGARMLRAGLEDFWPVWSLEAGETEKTIPVVHAKREATTVPRRIRAILRSRLRRSNLWLRLR